MAFKRIQEVADAMRAVNQRMDDSSEHRPPGEAGHGSAGHTPAAKDAAAKATPGRIKACADLFNFKFNRMWDGVDATLTRNVGRVAMSSLKLSTSVGTIVFSACALAYIYRQMKLDDPIGAMMANNLEPAAQTSCESSCLTCQGYPPSLNYVQVKAVGDTTRETMMTEYFNGLQAATKAGQSFEFTQTIMERHKKLLEGTLLTPDQRIGVQRVFVESILNAPEKHVMKPKPHMETKATK